MARTAGAARQTAAQRQTQQEEAEEAQTHEGAGLSVHMRTLRPSVPIPYLTLGDMAADARAVASRLPRRPAGKDLAFYGGLGALAVAGALEWPVALAVGGATWLLRSKRREHNGSAGAPAETGSRAADVGKSA
ncbi:hypothetical protein ABZV31_31405 [Streptomyces sp. NPDC005202]|uniref:hypothetical protein n=1 Tax=Streptomyces sp. NPDC005202 TaxID=3157021 RepID=UPI0033A0E172